MYKGSPSDATGCLFDVSGEGLKNLRSFRLVFQLHSLVSRKTYLDLNLGLGNVLLAAAAASDLLGLSNLVADGLGAEVLQGVALGGVDGHARVGKDGSKSATHCAIYPVSKRFTLGPISRSHNSARPSTV